MNELMNELVHLSDRCLRGQHDVLKGSPKNPSQLVREGAVVRDSTRFCLCCTVLVVDDAF